MRFKRHEDLYLFLWATNIYTFNISFVLKFNMMKPHNTMRVVNVKQDIACGNYQEIYGVLYQIYYYESSQNLTSGH